MRKKAINTEEQVRSSVSSIYSQLIDKRQQEKEEKEAKKLAEREEEEKKYLNEDGSKMSKKQKREKELDNWKTIVIGLTGDDLEYEEPKKKKKKYTSWIETDDTNTVLNEKPKKPKKRNYQKEFDPELNMLKNLVVEQNKFTADLQKRFLNAAGPATKDANMPNKSLVDLAAAINSGRANSLGVLREIGNIKKSIADLYMKQKKLDQDLGSGGIDTTDLGLLGSSIATSMFNPMGVGDSNNPAPPVSNTSTTQTTPVQTEPVQITPFDPSTWEGPSSPNDYTRFENIPYHIMVEKNKETGQARFVAIHDETGEEVVGADLPAVDPSTLQVNETDMTVRGPFDESFGLRYV